jgi:hypothetical protein
MTEGKGGFNFCIIYYFLNLKILISKSMADEKRKVLLVEDDPFIRDIYQVKFSQEGFEL